MALFGPNDPDVQALKIANKDRDDARGKRDKQAERLKGEQAKLADCIAAVNELTADLSDDTKLDAAIAKQETAQHKVTNRQKEVARASDRVTEMEARVAAIELKRQRKATAAAHIQIKDDLLRDGAACVAANNKLAITSRRAADLVLDAHPLVAYAMSAATEVQPAIEMIARVLEHRATLVINGGAPAALPPSSEEQATQSPAPIAPPATMVIVPFKHLRYIGPQGNVFLCGKMRRHSAPLAIAELAIKTGVAASELDDRVRKQIGSWGNFEPAEDSCSWIGDPPKAPAQVIDTAPSRAIPPPVKQSSFGQFEPMPGIKEPYKLIVPVQPVEPVAATRSARDDEG